MAYVTDVHDLLALLLPVGLLTSPATDDLPVGTWVCLHAHCHSNAIWSGFKVGMRDSHRSASARKMSYWRHCRSLQRCFFLPCPPNVFLSTQFAHLPQSDVVHPVHCPQPTCLLPACTVWLWHFIHTVLYCIVLQCMYAWVNACVIWSTETLCRQMFGRLWYLCSHSLWWKLHVKLLGCWKPFWNLVS